MLLNHFDQPFSHVSRYSSELDTTMRGENTLHVGSCLRKISYFDPCVLPAGDYGATRGPSTCLQWWLTSFECGASSLEPRSSDKETSSSFRLAVIGCRLTILRALTSSYMWNLYLLKVIAMSWRNRQGFVTRRSWSWGAKSQCSLFTSVQKSVS